MSDGLNVLTGATGLVGSHIAEQLRARGEQVRALVRPSSDTSRLREWGVELATGDMHDPDSLRQAFAGAAVVYHAAARVGDWGPWSLYQTDVIDATANVLEACHVAKVERLLHVSSLAVYGRPRVSPVVETSPLGQRFWLWDYYGKAKLRAEELVRQHGVRATIIRPGWVYGPRDRITMPRVIEALRADRVPILGSGTNPLNITFAADVAEAAILAANHPEAGGQAYNVCAAGEVTQKQLLDTLTEALGLPPVRRHVPVFLVMQLALLLELFGRLLRRPKPPTITRKAVALVSRSTQYSTEKARTQLGWRPQVDVREGVRRTLEWYLGQIRRGVEQQVP